jgi:hypothetical protein
MQFLLGARKRQSRVTISPNALYHMVQRDIENDHSHCILQLKILYGHLIG